MTTTKPIAPTKHFFEYFNENLPKNWDEPALTDYDDVTSYTYGEMGTKMMQVQAMLEVAGLKAGDKIALIRADAQSTLFKGADLDVLRAVDCGEYAPGKALKREMITLSLRAD